MKTIKINWEQQEDQNYKGTDEDGNLYRFLYRSPANQETCTCVLISDLSSGSGWNAEEAYLSALNSRQTRNLRTEVAKKEFKEALNVFETAGTFIDNMNQHTVQEMLPLVNGLNRYIKSKLEYITCVLRDDDEKRTETMYRAFKNEAFELIHLLSK